MGHRIDELEHAVAQLARILADATASDRDLLNALGLLRRNREMSDEVIQHTLAWLQSSTNAGTRRELVRQLDGVSNASVKSPLMALMSTEPNDNVRRDAARSLRRFTDDPTVENVLWNAALNDPSEGVRERAGEALRDGPASETRLAALRDRATNPQKTLDEQLLAIEALRKAKAPTSDIIADLAEAAQNSQDPLQRARLFEAFDNMDEPVTKVPLVYGLQDPNPLVRAQAADALSRHGSDPAVREWLQHIASNDPDAKVRREASQALNERRR